ncbi:MAG: hypothetical protein AB2535_04205 [Candidatus Thiodiazotropha endolucinida]
MSDPQRQPILKNLTNLNRFRRRFLAMVSRLFEYSAGRHALGMILEHDDVRLAQNYDDGMGRYTNLGVARDVAIDPVNGDLKSVESVEGFVAYRHQ